MVIRPRRRLVEHAGQQRGEVALLVQEDVHGVVHLAEGDVAVQEVHVIWEGFDGIFQEDLVPSHGKDLTSFPEVGVAGRVEVVVALSGHGYGAPVGIAAHRIKVLKPF